MSVDSENPTVAILMMGLLRNNKKCERQMRKLEVVVKSPVGVLSIRS